MRVSKPISTITYNTIPFLKKTLKTLSLMGLISYYEYIEHLPDEDDKKRHIHLFLMPNKALDLVNFADYFIEEDPQNEKPLKCMPFRRSNSYGDWYWYSLHDRDYLKAKELTKKYYYSDSDIVTSDIDFHNTLVLENPLINFAHMSDVALRDKVCKAVYNGESLESLLCSGLVPLGKAQSVILFYRALEQCVSTQNIAKFETVE